MARVAPYRLPMPRRVFIIANPIAGGGRARRAAPALAEALRSRGLDAEFVFTTRGGDARRIATGLDPKHVDVAVAVGGDGTLNEVADGLREPSLPLAMLPMGTANVLACELRLPRRVPALADAIAAGRTRAHAIGIANGRRFLLFCGAGLDGAMVERVEQVRTGTLGKTKWVAPVLHVVRHLPRHSIDVELDDGTRREDLSEVMVARVRSYGGVFMLPRAVDAADPVFFVLCFRQRTRRAWFRAAAAACCLGGLRDGVHCELLRATGARVHAATPAPYQIDGDLGGRTPIEIDLLAEPARLVVPSL